MPGKLKVRVFAGRNLPVMDRASDLTDAFVEVKFGSTTHKTDVFRKSLNPQWNSDWYRFEVDDEDLQDEPLQIKVLDHDTYSSHDSIGKVYIDLNPLLAKDHPSVINGWFPIYDTMHGIRGELNVLVKVELFSDFNKFRQSSCGVNFYCTSGIPQGYRIHALHGFVEELVVNDDPEYQWIDKIRSMRASNEARQIQFSKLSGELKRKIGLKVLELGGNSVIGYRQCFDLEGESGIVVRAIGTSVTLARHSHPLSPLHSDSPIRDPILDHSPAVHTPLGRMSSSPGFFPPNTPPPQILAPPPRLSAHRGSLPTTVLPTRGAFAGCSIPLPEDAMIPASPADVATSKPITFSPAKPGVASHAVPGRRLSDSDIGTPPKGSSLTGSSGSGGGGSGGPKNVQFSRSVLPQHNIEMLEYPFFTMKSFPQGFLVHLGGVVSARSVKLLDKIHNPDEPETRDAWWAELRTEIRSHARAIGCHAVVGYSESTSICDEIIILSACGTAATVCLSMHDIPTMTLSLDRSQFEKEKEKDKTVEKCEKERKHLHVDVNLANQVANNQLHRVHHFSDGSDGEILPQCSICHIPYKATSLPFPVHLTKCAVCGNHKVPDILFTTIERPPELPMVGKGCLVQARICRTKKDSKGETNAKEISDSLPFVEYELYHQLVNKMKVKGMNSLFGLKIQISVGDTLLVAVATATGVYSAPLPSPALPKILDKTHCDMVDASLHGMQRKILDNISRNKDIYNLNISDNISNSEFSPKAQLTDDSEDEFTSDLELSSGNKDTFIIEIDDAEDAQIVSVLLDPPVPEGFDVCNTDNMPGVGSMARNIQTFSKVWRGELGACTNKGFSTICDIILRSIYFKLRAMTPCCLAHLDFDVDLPEEDEIQISITGICIGVGEPPSLQNGLMDIVPPEGRTEQAKPGGAECEDGLMFHMEMAADMTAAGTQLVSQAAKASFAQKSEKRIRYHSGPHQKDGSSHIELTPLADIPGGRIDQYLGHLNFFIIRETTSVREEGGLNGFMHSFIAEVMAICRAHVGALGGNALVAYRMTECTLEDNVHKNQSQCLVNVCGDMVQVIYGLELQQLPGGGTPGSLSSSKGGGSTTGSSGVSPALLEHRKSSPRNSPKIALKHEAGPTIT